MKKSIIIYTKSILRFALTFLLGVFIVKILNTLGLDFFYFRENSCVVYAVLYLAGIVACTNK